jgi:flagellar motor component MotA
MYALIGTLMFSASAYLLMHPFSQHIGHPAPGSFSMACACCAGMLWAIMLLIEHRAQSK